MATTIEMIEQMQANAERARAAAQSGPRSFVSNSIVLLTDGQRALVRPLVNMDGAIVMPMHDKFKNTDASLASRKDQYGAMVAAPIANLCAVHFGKPCAFCVNAKEQKLEARFECFVPVYLYGIKNPDDSAAAYTDPDGNVKPVKGFRMLRLKQGSAILNQLMSVFKDADYGRDVTGCDFLVERHGSGMDTSYSCTPKPPKTMEPNMKAAIPPIAKFQEILEEIYPIKVVEHAPVNGASPDGGAVTLDLAASTANVVPPTAGGAKEEAFTF